MLHEFAVGTTRKLGEDRRSYLGGLSTAGCTRSEIAGGTAAYQSVECLEFQEGHNSLMRA